MKPGNAMALANVPVGTIVHNIEMKIGKGAAMALGGHHAQVVGRHEGYVIVRRILATAPDPWPNLLKPSARVQPDHMDISRGKAGRGRGPFVDCIIGGVTRLLIIRMAAAKAGPREGAIRPPPGKPTKGKTTPTNKSRPT